MTFHLEYTDKRDLVRKLRAALLEHEEWITPKEFHYRYNVTSEALSQRLKRWEGKKLLEIEARRGPTGRIILMKVTPELRAMMNSCRNGVQTKL